MKAPIHIAHSVVHSQRGMTPHAKCKNYMGSLSKYVRTFAYKTSRCLPTMRRYGNGGTTITKNNANTLNYVEIL